MPPIRQTIDDFRRGRLEERAYLERIRAQRDKLDARDDEDDPTPHELRGKGNETAFWGIARKELRRVGIDDPGLSVRISVSLADIIENLRRVGWQHDRDIQNDMRNAMDDFFFDEVMGPAGVEIDAAVMDSIINEVLSAAREFPRRLQAASSLFASEGIELPKLLIRPMTKRWGSYTPKGSLVLNLDPIRAPVLCIDYVIVHELAHAFEPHHGPKWRQLMDKTMPDWRERKRRLETSLV